MQFSVDRILVNLGNSDTTGKFPKKCRRVITMVKEAHFQSSLNEKRHKYGKTYKVFC